VTIFARWGVLVAAFLLFATPVVAAPTFPALTGRVVDDAQLLSPEAEAKLTAELATLERQTGHQLVVATLPTLQGYEIEDYGYQLLRAWGVGRKDQDDGVILIVAPQERKVRIEVGYGLEPVMTDALSSLIISRAILPAFKAGNYEQGVVAGAEAIARQIGLPEEEAKAQAAQAAAAAQPSRSGGGSGAVLIFVLFIFFWVLSGMMRMFGPRQRYGGRGLWWLLPLLLSSSSRRGGGWSGGSGGGWGSGGGGFGGGGFSGGGGSGGGGGASGSW
jgi:uncharacterized protein